jgi:ring-1,2-phenylacetyl-CoA epoxidase subunit PaaC
MNKELLHYIFHLADNSLIHGHRLSEWCGHGPALEVDMALSNIALDNIGAARSFYQYAAELEGNGKTEDDYPFFRDVTEFKNVLLVELPKGDFGDTIAKSFYFDAYQFVFYKALSKSCDKQIASIAIKSLKEVTYHLRFSSEWVIRLGDGTGESKQRIQKSILKYWEYTGELFAPSEIEQRMIEQEIAPNIAELKTEWLKIMTETIASAHLSFPLSVDNAWFQQGGKIGLHTEYMGFALAELQYMQKTYPNSNW